MIACRKGGPAALESSPKADPAGNGGQGAVRRRGASHGPFFAPEPGAGLGSALGITDGTRSRCGKIARSWLETQYV